MGFFNFGDHDTMMMLSCFYFLKKDAKMLSTLCKIAPKLTVMFFISCWFSSVIVTTWGIVVDIPWDCIVTMTASARKSESKIPPKQLLNKIINVERKKRRLTTLLFPRKTKNENDWREREFQICKFSSNITMVGNDDRKTNG